MSAMVSGHVWGMRSPQFGFNIRSTSKPWDRSHEIIVMKNGIGLSIEHELKGEMGAQYIERKRGHA